MKKQYNQYTNLNPKMETVNPNGLSNRKNKKKKKKKNTFKKLKMKTKKILKTAMIFSFWH